MQYFKLSDLILKCGSNIQSLRSRKGVSKNYGHCLVVYAQTLQNAAPRDCNMLAGLQIGTSTYLNVSKSIPHTPIPHLLTAALPASHARDAAKLTAFPGVKAHTVFPQNSLSLDHYPPVSNPELLVAEYDDPYNFHIPHYADWDSQLRPSFHSSCVSRTRIQCLLMRGDQRVHLHLPRWLLRENSSQRMLRMLWLLGRWLLRLLRWRKLWTRMTLRCWCRIGGFARGMMRRV